MSTLIVVTLRRGEMSFAGYRERVPNRFEAYRQYEKMRKWKPGEEMPPGLDLGFDKAFVEGRIRVREYDEGAAELFRQIFLALPGVLSSSILDTRLKVVNKLGTDVPFATEVYTKVEKDTWLVDLCKLYPERFEEEVARHQSFTDWVKEMSAELEEETGED